MPYTRLRYHFVFATKKRARWIWPRIEEFLYPVMIRLTERAGGHTIRIGGVEDHVHTICAIKPKISVSDFIERIKSESSQAVRGRFKNLYGFKWQEGYGAFTLNPHDMDRVVAYVENQKEHHRTGKLWEPYEKTGANTPRGPARKHVQDAQSEQHRRSIGREVARQHKVIRLWGPSNAPLSHIACPTTDAGRDVGGMLGALRLA